MDSQQKERIENNIQNLDYLIGTGVIGGSKATLADEFFVFISAGGSGREALISLKKRMKNQIEDTDFREKTMFLAVDSDWAEQDQAVAAGDLDSTEIVKLPYKGVHIMINPEFIAPQTKKWVHPELWHFTGGAEADITLPAELNGAAIRQFGRLLFCQSQALSAYQLSLERVYDKLKGRGVNRKIRVFFLAGIAGGTGSGMIVDLVYFTKYSFRMIFGGGHHWVEYYGYLLLPSACGIHVDDTRRGNRNAYAALKEIDYYMTITNRNEHFVMDYGTALARNVDIESNIFDFCTLVEGVGANGVFLENKAESARRLIADSILNVVCAGQTKNENEEGFFLLDSFRRHGPAEIYKLIVAQSHRYWPRDTNYIYSVIGISTCIVPVDLLTSYVVKKVFDVLFKEFRKAEDVTYERTVEFITNCGLDVNDLAREWRVTSKEYVLNEIQSQVDAEFKAYGPYYVVNLLNQAVDLIENDFYDYMHIAQSKMTSLLANRNKWENVLAKYVKAVDYLRKQNHYLYEVYAYVLNVLRDQFEKSAEVLTDRNEYQRVFGKSSYWTPIDLTHGNNETFAVEKYLGSFYENGKAERLAEKFIEDLCDKRDRWTQLAAEYGKGQFDAAGEMREFIRNHLDNFINTTLEKFLVIAYSGEVDSAITERDYNGQEIPSKATYLAAERLLERLYYNSCVMASTSGGFLKDVYRFEYITIPMNCVFLYRAIKERCERYGIDPHNVFLNTTYDRIVLSKEYLGVPAWALNWTALAETDYEIEGGPDRVGIHLDQGEDSDWKVMPNLYPESKWTKTEAEKRGREAAISAKIRELMDEAKELGMLRPNGKDPDYYDLILMKEGAEAADLLTTAEIFDGKTYEIAEVLDILVEKKAATRDKLIYTGMVMSTTDTLTNEELEAFRYDLACQTMRMLHAKWEPLAKSIETVKELIRFFLRWGDYPGPIKLILFIEALIYGTIEYDAEQMSWLVTVGDKEILCDLSYDKFQRQCAHYYGFVAFSELDNEKREEIQEYVNNERKAKGALAGNRKDLSQRLSAIRSAKEGTEKPWPEGSPFADDGNEASWPMSSIKFAKKADKETDNIRNFYDVLIENL